MATDETWKGDEIVDLFHKMDILGEGVVDVGQLEQLISTHADVATRQALLQKYRKMETEGCIASRGTSNLTCEAVVMVLMELLESYSDPEFDDFMMHCHSALEFLQNVSDSSRRHLVVYHVFKAWDMEGCGILDSENMQRVIESTKWGRVQTERIRETFAPYENKWMLQKIERSADVSLKEFQRIMAQLLDGVSEAEGFEMLHQLKEAIKQEAIDEHVVTKYLRPRSAKRATSPRPDTPGSPPRLSRPDSVASCRRGEATRATRMAMLMTEVKHCFDGLSYDDIECTVDQIGSIPQFFQTVAAPVCILLKIPALTNKGGELEYWEGLKQVLLKDYHNFLGLLHDYNMVPVTYETIQHVEFYASDPAFSYSRLLPKSTFLAHLVKWVKSVVELTCYENEWEYPPAPVRSQIMYGGAQDLAKPRSRIRLREAPGILDLVDMEEAESNLDSSTDSIKLSPAVPTPSKESRSIFIDNMCRRKTPTKDLRRTVARAGDEVYMDPNSCDPKKEFLQPTRQASVVATSSAGGMVLTPRSNVSPRSVTRPFSSLGFTSPPKERRLLDSISSPSASDVPASPPRRDMDIQACKAEVQAKLEAIKNQELELLKTMKALENLDNHNDQPLAV